MSCDVDELDVNPFFGALQSTYSDLYEKAQEKCYVVCVPQKSSLLGVAINQKLIETHILKPSPYFKGQFLTIQGNKTVVIEENSDIIKTVDGFDEARRITILSEELAYNKNYQHYKILIIESPFDSKTVRNPSVKESNSSNVFFTHKSTFIESKSFLQSFKEYTKIILQLDKNIAQFNQHYMVLADYLTDAGSRIQAMINDTAEKCLKCTRNKLQSDSRYKDVLYGAIECYILGMVHNKVYSVICDVKRKDDKDLLEKCLRLQTVTPAQLGVRKEFSCSLPLAVVELECLDSLCTPREKLNCLKSTIDRITSGLEAALSQTKQKQLYATFEKPDVPCLTSDDLIPILVTVIARAKCQHLESDLFYMENFNWHSTIKDMDNVSYCLVTFKAAVQFMQTSNFDNIKHQSPKMKRDNSLSDLMSTAKISQDSRSIGGKYGFDHGSNKGLRMDRQLSKISTFFQDTDVGDSTPPKDEKKIRSIFTEGPRRHSPRNVQSSDQKSNQNPLGDFLSSLQDDMFDQPFGKQT